MLVNTASDLDAVRTNQTGTYALGTKITFDPNQTFTPIPNFTGLFDGQGQTIANLTIASTAQNVGLFGSIGSTGVVRNLNLADVTVSGLGSQFVGTLAGTNAGTISNVSATDVAVRVGSNGNGGGLVGLNSGTITNAFASGGVTGAAGTNGFTTLGGLAAVNLGAISNSVAAVDVGSPDTANLQAAGLVGNNSGTILSSAALGNVQTGNTSIAGGLVASNSVGGVIISSQASGNVTVGTGSVAGSLVGANNGTIRDSTGSGTVISTGSGTDSGTGTGSGTGIPSNPLALLSSTLLPPFSPELRELLAAQQTQQIVNLTSTLQFAALSTAPVVTMTQRSEEHTSELQSLRHLVCRLLLEKKNIKTHNHNERMTNNHHNGYKPNSLTL